MVLLWVKDLAFVSPRTIQRLGTHSYDIIMFSNTDTPLSEQFWRLNVLGRHLHDVTIWLVCKLLTCYLMDPPSLATTVASTQVYFLEHIYISYGRSLTMQIYSSLSLPLTGSVIYLFDNTPPSWIWTGTIRHLSNIDAPSWIWIEKYNRDNSAILTFLLHGYEQGRRSLNSNKDRLEGGRLETISPIAMVASSLSAVNGTI